jgi:hypothetical protein
MAVVLVNRYTHIPFLNSHLVAVQKPGGRGVRPIAIGKVWVRIATLCKMAACTDASAYLAPLQPGVCIHGGTEAAVD